ncbi:RNA polymerase sigma-70 factor (ECF subfamily) [Novosphingobium sp. PhB165]|uniref:RNA polymerase sigma factor n=1 Tax=Novosphingobium sp. PhB165 TaxID=2485105 RepID=UPI0010488CFD|nr:RNA polymerase sigma factor [Novosphingobium sp. PhB165]TCM16150.1 RNA polymerase sigma-70 factor (ECF subfamily) [Novosphingobium sp. PhB165]
MAWLRDIDVWFADHVFLHRDRHRRYAASIVRNADDAEELVQEAYARLFALDNWRSIANPHAFTVRIIRNLAIEKARRADVVRIGDAALLHRAEIADEQPTPDVVAADRSELDRVVSAMQELPPRMREALYLRRVEGLPPPQVAEKMNISVSTVETHLVKGLRLLIRRLAGRDGQNGAENSVQCEATDKTDTIRNRRETT